jgi:hypothetical protein
MSISLILGSGPNVVACRNWPRAPFDRIVAINNAWRVRPDWDDLIHPEDFARDRMPDRLGPGQRIIGAADFVPAQNALGGFVYAGGTMAFTAAYWALHVHRPRIIAMLGCDMVYPSGADTHFYGTGTADPLRDDVTLQSLEAKSARLMVLAARQGCAMVNLSEEASRLVFPRSTIATLPKAKPRHFVGVAAILSDEARLGYDTPTGRYWEEAGRFDPDALAALDASWLQLAAAPDVNNA